MLHKTSKMLGYHLIAIDGEIGHVDDFLIEESNWSAAIWWSIPATGSAGGPCSFRQARSTSLIP